MNAEKWIDEKSYFDDDREHEPCCQHDNSRHFLFRASIRGPREAGCLDCSCEAEPEQKRGRR